MVGRFVEPRSVHRSRTANKKGAKRAPFLMADREGFEPPVQSPVRRISSAVHSTTLPPVRGKGAPILNPGSACKGSGRRARAVRYFARHRHRLAGRRRKCRRRALSHPPSSPRTPPDRGALAPDLAPRRGGRVVECTALEMRHRCKPIGGSNPSLSAISLRRRCRSTTMQALCAPAGLRPSGQHCAYNRNKRRAPSHRLEVRRHVPHSIQGSGPSLLRLTR